MELSIIVPVYKVESLLDRCVESILAQTFRDFEVILVDDGSPDRSGEMCDEWAKRDSRIRVLHKANGGVCDARNAGLDIARGNVIGFVDSDDYIAPEMFEVLHRNMCDHHADVSMCGFVNVYPSGPKKRCMDDTVRVWNQEEAIRNILRGRELSVHMYTKFFARRLFDGIRFTKGVISEEAYIIMDLMDRVQVAVFTPLGLYYYAHRTESLNTCAFNPCDLTRLGGHWKNYLYVKEKFPHLRKIAFERYLAANAFVASKSILSGVGTDTPEVRECLAVLRRNIPKIVCAGYFRPRRKAIILLMLASKRLYRFVSRRIRSL
jgi:glycosyltransferase involved in cell wall biosynthesis